MYTIIFPFPACAYIPGIEKVTKHMIAQYARVTDPKVGLVTNQTGCTLKGIPSVLFLQQQGITITSIFAPEHGYWGTVPAGEEVTSTIDPLSGVQVVSLYGKGTGKKIAKEMFSSVDIVIFDMQDSGMRHYTYVSTLYTLMEALRKSKISLIICDRPNPLGGIMEGPLVDSTLHSFISIASIPLRHGMTLGELALYFNRYYMQNEVHMHVVPVGQYKREKLKTLLRPLSPNLQTIQSVYGYSFLGLLGEIKPFNVGTGSEPFYTIRLARSLPQTSLFFAKIRNICARAGIVTKMIEEKQYQGIRLFFDEAKEWSGVALLTSFLAEAHALHIPLKFSAYFDKAFGAVCLRKTTQDVSYKCAAGCVCKELKQFYNRARNCFLYVPFPLLHTAAVDG